MSNKDKNLEDRGWSHMAAILDDELPQKKRKRKMILWLMFGCGFCFALLLSWFGIAEKHVLLTDNNKMEQEWTSDSPILDPKIKNQTLFDNKQSSEKIHTDDRVEDKEEIREIKIQSSTIDPIKKVQKPATRIDDVTSVHEESLVIKQPNMKEKSIVENRNSSSFSMPRFNDEKVVPIDGTTRSANRIIDSIRLSESRDAVWDRNIAMRHTSVDTSRPQFDYESLDRSLLALKRRHNIDFSPARSHEDSQQNQTQPIQISNDYYLFAGGVIGVNPSGQGYQLGVGRRFSTSKLNVLIEGGFSRMDYTRSGTESKSVEVDIVLDETTDNSSFDVNLDPAVQEAVRNNQISGDLLLTKLTSVFLTLGIEKPVTKRFNLLAGITASRFLSLENSQLNFVSVSGMFQSNLNEFSISKSAFFENNLFNTYEIASTLGIGYQVSKRLNISANYHLALTDILNRSNDLDNNLPEGSSTEASTSSGNYKIFRRSAEIRLRYSF